MTDGYSGVSPRAIANRLLDVGVKIIVISMAPPRYTNRDELRSIAGNPERVFDYKTLEVKIRLSRFVFA
jgi:hypothetical protein